VLRDLDATLLAAGRTIYVLSDEPYAELVYDGRTMPSTLACLTHAIVCTSWSKSLSLPGERIGCTVVSPRCEDHDLVAQAAAYCNRTLGFVNAPALFQKVIERTIGAHVDIGLYEKRRNRLAEVIRDAGIDVDLPEGGLYLFPRIPDCFPAGDDVAFARGKQAGLSARDDVAFARGKQAGLSARDDVAFAAACARHRILLVPGSSFHFPGHVRLCFAVSETCIENSAQAFQALGREYGFLS
jgi:aspartate aminotransferase